MFTVPATILDNTVFARVEGNRIVEYPVTAGQIKVRKLPFSYFRQVAFEDAVTAPDFHRVVESIRLERETPVVSFSVEPMTIQEILDSLWEGKETLNPTDTPPQAVLTLFTLASAIVTKRLDDFAKTKDYDNIVSLCSYVDDPDENLDKEGRRGRFLRSQAWTSIRGYQNQVLTGELPVPRTEKELLACVPEFTWDN